MLKILSRDRSLWLLVLIAAFTLVVGRLALPDSWALRAVVKTGYWWMFALCLAFAWSNWRAWSATTHSSSRIPWLPLAAILAGGLIWQAHEAHGFKILSDEVLLLGTSQSMHLDRDVGYPVRTTDVYGTFQILQAVLDKRPFFFPFAVSLVHDLTGYRPQNPFWFNTGCSFVLLGLVYVLGRRVTGQVGGAWLFLLIAIGSPLLAQQAAGGGFELLNLTLLTLWCLWVMRFYEDPRPENQDALVLTAVALASTRYESVLILVPTAGILLSAWWRRGEVLRTPLTWAAPLLLLPTFWLNQAFSANTSLWEMQSMGATRPFGLEFVSSNLGHALAFFFSTDGYQPNSLAWSALGFLALPLAGLWALRLVRQPKAGSTADWGLLLASLGPLAITGLMMLYFWGQFDHPVIRRLSLPTHLLLLIATGVAASRVVVAWRAKWTVLAGCAGLGLVAWSLPTMAKNIYGHEYSPGVAHAWRSELIKKTLPEGALILDKDTLLWSANRFAVTPILQATQRRAGIAYHLRNHSFTGVYVVQNYRADPATGELVIAPEDELGPDFELEPLRQQRLQLLQFIRLSRVKAIRDDEGVWSQAVDVVPVGPAPEKFAEPEREAAKKVFLEKWIKQLP